MNNLSIAIIIIVGLSLSFIIIAKTLRSVIDTHLSFIRRQSYVDKHEIYMKLLSYYMDKAFDIIYKDRILIYSIEGTKPDDNEVKQNSIDFAKLTLKLMGPTLIEEFTYLYGDEDTFIFSLVEYFNTKAENDEIKQASINNIMDGPDEII